MKVTNNNRPAGFDERVLAYMPGLRKLARRYAFDRESREDLVTDTIAHCLLNWHKLREDGSMWMWLSWAMRSIARDARVKRRVELVEDPDGIISRTASVPPTQEAYVEFSLLVSRATSPAARLVVRNAMGAALHELAAERGVTRQRIDQLIKQGRDELRKAA